MVKFSNGCATAELSCRRAARAGSALVLVTGLLATACGPNLPAGVDDNSQAIRESLAAAFRQCTIDSGYNPDSQAALGPYELGAGELDWRDCAYDALERVVEPNLNMPEALEALIDDDGLLTEGIEDGTTTRAERGAVIAARAENIRVQEQMFREQQATQFSAADVLEAANQNTDYERIRSDIDAISRMY